jgi:tetratricopeptide (TPR) repeat protein
VAELPPGYREVPEEERKKAQGFFTYGRSVAATGHYDYAIERYLAGLSLDPDAVSAHQELREISLKRKASGGKGLGMIEAMKLKKKSKDDKENMLNAEKLLAYDPGNSDHMLTIAQTAARLGYYDTVMWAGPMVAQAEADGGKPDVNKFLLLRDVYKKIQQFRLAVEMVSIAVRFKPEDMDLIVELRNLAAQQTMQDAGYDKRGSFRDQVRDMDAQIRLLDADKEVTDIDVLGRMIVDAEKALAAEPNEPGKLNKLIDLLVKTELPKNEDRAAKLLQEWFDRTKQFSFRQRIGQIRIKQRQREERVKHEQHKAAPADAEVRKEYEEIRRKLWEFELSEFAQWVTAYPTELSYRFEMGKRQLFLRQFDEAINNFQLARNDPKHRTDAQIMLGMSFYEAGFLDEADETLGILIRDYPNQESPKFKLANYWRGRVLEQKGQTAEAIKLYSKIFQRESGYKDVSARIRKLHEKPAAAPPPENE